MNITKRVVASTLVLLVGISAAIFTIVEMRHGPAPRGIDGMPFELPAQSRLKNSPRKVFAHYFTAYPISLDNKPSASDYYTANYLNPAGEGGIHAAYGGLLRERPLPRAPDRSTTWQLNDMKTDVRRATEAGLDGFTVDMLALAGPHWDRLRTLLQAAKEVDPYFQLVLMPDSDSSVVESAATLASAVSYLERAYKDTLYHLSDGRLVVSPFYPERIGATYWRTWMGIMADRYHITIALVPCFLNYDLSAPEFEEFSYGFSSWGFRNPAANGDLAGTMADSQRRGKIWMQPVSLQDARPRDEVYDEANNTENLRTTWMAAINDADWVQIVTWNDYSEQTEIAPSTHIGSVPLEICLYYLVRFKAGSFPDIRRDVAYVSHRVQFSSAMPVGGQTRLMRLRLGSSPPRDAVEAMTFLTAPAQVVVQIGRRGYSRIAPAGQSIALYPLSEGRISVTVLRVGVPVTTTLSPFQVMLAPTVQDLQYHFAGSR